jgi:hypothetical protein
MTNIQKHFDVASLLVILITLSLFVVGLLVKGFVHDLLLEAGVLLVSVKLIMMAYKNSLAAENLNKRLDELRSTLMRLERLARADRAPEIMQSPNT